MGLPFHPLAHLQNTLTDLRIVFSGRCQMTAPTLRVTTRRASVYKVNTLLTV